MEKEAKIYIAGHRGLVGSAIRRRLGAEGFTHLVYRTHKQLDLLDTEAVKEFFCAEKPDYVFLAAAKVGGILANDHFGADFIYQNLVIQNNVISQAYRAKVKKLLFLGSSCVYPKLASQPIKEDYFLDGTLEETNKPYAIAKIAGIVMCQAFNKQYHTNFISVMPTNLYGPNDNFDLESSHVLPALIRKFHEAKVTRQSSVTLWGTGSARREFLYVDDLADACLFLMQRYNDSAIVNVGAGEDISILDLAGKIKSVVDYPCELVFDRTKPDGTPRKLLDVSKLHALGWKAQTSLDEGLRETYNWFTEHDYHQNTV